MQGPGLRSDESPLSQASARPSSKRGGTAPRCRPADPSPHPHHPPVSARCGPALAALERPFVVRALFFAWVPGLQSRALEWAGGAPERRRPGDPLTPRCNFRGTVTCGWAHFRTFVLGNCFAPSPPPQGCMLDFVFWY